MTPCIEWVKGRTGEGYGALIVDGKQISAHRHAWIKHRGPIPAGMCVLHRCDNPPCINPDHLFLGTIGDNTRDMIAKGRGADRRGAAGPNAKLTPEIVAAIRADTGTTRALGKKYGIANSHVSNLRSNKRWVLSE